jgi:hypothetical protein
MSNFVPGPWHVQAEDEAYGIFSGDALIAVVLPDDIHDKTAERATANLIGSAPLLLEACKKAKELLDNNHVVTQEGFRINTSDVREKLLDAIFRAEGYRIEHATK